MLRRLIQEPGYQVCLSPAYSLLHGVMGSAYFLHPAPVTRVLGRGTREILLGAFPSGLSRPSFFTASCPWKWEAALDVGLVFSGHLSFYTVINSLYVHLHLLQHGLTILQKLLQVWDRTMFSRQKTKVWRWITIQHLLQGWFVHSGMMSWWQVLYQYPASDNQFDHWRGHEWETLVSQ